MMILIIGAILAPSHSRLEKLKQRVSKAPWSRSSSWHQDFCITRNPRFYQLAYTSSYKTDFNAHLNLCNQRPHKFPSDWLEVRSKSHPVPIHNELWTFQCNYNPFECKPLAATTLTWNPYGCSNDLLFKLKGQSSEFGFRCSRVQFVPVCKKSAIIIDCLGTAASLQCTSQCHNYLQLTWALWLLANILAWQIS